MTDFVFEAVKANAVYEGRYLLGTRSDDGIEYGETWPTSLSFPCVCTDGDKGQVV